MALILELVILILVLIIIVPKFLLKEKEPFEVALINPHDNCPYERSRFFKNVNTNQRPIEVPLVNFGRCARYTIQPGINLIEIGDIMTWLGWTISFNARLSPSTSSNKTVILEKLNLSPISRVSRGSPAILYDPKTKDLTLYTKNPFGVNELKIPEVDLSNWTTLTWVQWKNKTYFYINGELVKWETLGNSVPIVYLGPMIIRSQEVEVADFQICNKGQNSETVEFDSSSSS